LSDETQFQFKTITQKIAGLALLWIYREHDLLKCLADEC